MPKIYWKFMRLALCALLIPIASCNNNDRTTDAKFSGVPEADRMNTKEVSTDDGDKNHEATPLSATLKTKEQVKAFMANSPNAQTMEIMAESLGLGLVLVQGSPRTQEIWKTEDDAYLTIYAWGGIVTSAVLSDEGGVISSIEYKTEGEADRELRVQLEERGNAK